MRLMARRTTIGTDTNASSFGAQLRLLRRQARLTQADLGIAVGYSDAQICRLELGRRPPDLTTLVALFFPALGLDPRAEAAERLLALAAAARAEDLAAPPDPPSAAPRPAEEPAIVSSLPQPSGPLVGRASERALIAARLAAPNVRLLTLVGPPGVGKTHLALQVAHDLHERYTDGVCFVDLSPIAEPALVASALALALDVSEGQRDAATALREALRDRQMLLVLDNFEQVAEAAPLLRELLATAPRLSLLVTSRVALRLSVEQTLLLGPLAVPSLAQLPPLAELEQVDSMTLLLARLRANTPYLALTASNALTLAAICVRVDGLPLAIELVAARGKLFSPQELLSEVAQHFLQVRRRGRDIPARQQSLIAALAWSYGRLDPETQALFDRLSLFAGGWTLDAAVEVADLAGLGRASLIEQLEDLLDNSLVQRHSEQAGTRFTMLSMLREYGQAQLEQRGEREALMRRMLAHYGTLAARAERYIQYGSEQAAWVRRVEADHDNMRFALHWALGANEQLLGLRLAGSLWRFWYTRGYLREGLAWLESFLHLAPEQFAEANPLTQSEHAHALDGAGVLAWRQSSYAQSEGWYVAALERYRAAGQPLGEAKVLCHMGMLYGDRDDLTRAAGFYERSLPIYQAHGEAYGAASVLHNLGNLYNQQNNSERALSCYAECLTLYEQLDNPSGIALIELGRGAIARDQGESAQAEASFRRSMALAEQMGDEWAVATAQLNLGNLANDRGDSVAARELLGAALAKFTAMGDQQSVSATQNQLGLVELLAGEIVAAVAQFRQALMLANAIGFRFGVADSLEGLAACASAGQPRLSAQLLAVVAAIRAEGDVDSALADARYYRRIQQIAEAALGPTQWAAAWAAGERLSVGEAVALALAQITGMR